MTLTAAAVQRFLSAVSHDEALAVTAIRPISGGYSRETTLAEVQRGDGTAARYVLRCDPPPGSGVFDSDRDSEWQLLRALSAVPGGVQVPTSRWYDGSGAYLGAKCIVGDFYDSRSLQDLARESDDLTAVRETFVDVVSRVHGTPLDLLPTELARPTDWDGYLDSVLDLLVEAGSALPDQGPALRYTAARLRSVRPEPVPLTLVHGDCHPSNVLVGAAGPMMIDWEFGRVGDPREDLGYYLQMPVAPNLYGTDPEAFLAAYRERTGLTTAQLDQRTVAYFMALGIARLVLQMVQALRDVSQGRPRGVMATYLVNALSLLYVKFFAICRDL